ncbi:MAG: DNA-3-methyladenine glycosylase I [Comamonadaceae bacterium]|nr:MAG: DNA-3-methyladenine glycosylase I [Comamonadaceae bacterium]
MAPSIEPPDAAIHGEAAADAALAEGLFRGSDGLARCGWCRGSAAYQDYHDREWGFPVVDERRLFEKLCLEGFQSGLSWLTILNKRQAFRAAFADFEPEVLAGFGAADIERLLGNPSIVRHRGKIEATLCNARRLLELRAEFGSLVSYAWAHEPAAQDRPAQPSHRMVRSFVTSAESIAMSADLKRRGWRFVGPTTVYAFMQAMGLVNDHVHGCHVRPRVAAARKALSDPETESR